MQTALPNLKISLDKVRAIADDIDAHAQDALKVLRFWPVMRRRCAPQQSSSADFWNRFFEKSQKK